MPPPEKEQPEYVYMSSLMHAPLQALNAQFDGPLKKLMCRKLRPHVDEAILISIDKLGADVRVRVGSDYSVERIGWQHVSHSAALNCA